MGIVTRTLGSIKECHICKEKIRSKLLGKHIEEIHEKPRRRKKLLYDDW